MIVFAGVLLGGFMGARLATRHGGTRADKVQFAATCAIAGALAGLVLTILAERLFA